MFVEENLKKSENHEFSDMQKWICLFPVLSPRSRTQVIQRIVTRRLELAEKRIDVQNSRVLKHFEIFLANQRQFQRESLKNREENVANALGTFLKAGINRKRVLFNYELRRASLRHYNLLIDSMNCSQLRWKRRQQFGGILTKGLTSQQYKDFLFELRTKPKAGEPSLLAPIEGKESNDPISPSRVVNQSNQYQQLLARFLHGRAVQKVNEPQRLIEAGVGNRSLRE